MNPLTAQMLAFRGQAQNFAEAVLPASIRFAGESATYEASTGGLRNNEKLSENGGGFVDITTVTFRLRKALRREAPNENSLLFWVDGGRELRIKQVSTGGLSDPTWLIACESITE